jgi:hypothetical protein
MLARKRQSILPQAIPVRNGSDARLFPHHRNQYQVHIADFEQNTVKRGLIGHCPGQYCLPVGVMRERHAIEPRPPYRIEMPFDTDSVLRRLCGGGRKISAAAAGSRFAHNHR